MCIRDSQCTAPQQVIDEALCIGANDQNSRLIICAYFKKDKPDNARFLAEHYGENGAGFYLDGRQYAIWYLSLIHISRNPARNSRCF